MGSPLPHTKGATQISSKPIAFPVPSTWINEQDIIQLAKGRAGGRKGSCPGDDSRLHGQEGLCNDNMVNTLFSSWDHWRHLCCHPGFGGSRLKEAPLKNVLFPRAFLLIYCSGHFQRPPQASISNGTGLMETLWCSSSGRPLPPPFPCRLPAPALVAGIREHFGGRGFAPHQRGQPALILPEAPSTGKLEPITKQLCYILRKKQMNGGKREKMIITIQQQTELHHAPQREAAVLNLAI